MGKEMEIQTLGHPLFSLPERMIRLPKIVSIMDPIPLKIPKRAVVVKRKSEEEKIEEYFSKLDISRINNSKSKKDGSGSYSKDQLVMIARELGILKTSMKKGDLVDAILKKFRG